MRGRGGETEPGEEALHTAGTRQRDGIDVAGTDHVGEREKLGEEGVPDAARITWLLGSNGLYVHELVGERVDLEAVFLELTQGLGPGTVDPPARGSRRARRRGDGGPA